MDPSPPFVAAPTSRGLLIAVGSAVVAFFATVATQAAFPPATVHVFDPLSLRPSIQHSVTTPALLPPKARPAEPVPSKLAVAGGAAFAGAAVAGAAGAAPALLGVTAQAGDWLPQNAVTAFLAAAFAAVVVAVGVQIARAPSGDMPFETLRGSVSKKLNSTTNVGNEKGRQLLGIKGALDEDVPLWKIRLQLTKPVTWVPLIWGVACGAAASGNYHWWNPLTIGQQGHIPFELAATDLAKAVSAMVLSGPFLTGYTQTINDWYDREIDAINEPYRPIPSGRITEGQVIAQIWTLLLGGLAVAAGLDLWAGHWGDGVSGVALGAFRVPPLMANALFGAFVAYIYSAPPLKLKQSGWIGNYALGASYIALPWWCGQSLFGELNSEVMVLSVLYSMAGLGIAIINDFKSIEGDRQMGLMSLPVQFGVERAKWICAGTIDATQLAVALYLAYIGETNYAITLFGLVAPQIFFQLKYFLKDPLKFDVKYQASAQPFLVLGILCTALAMGHHQQVLQAML